MWAALAKSLSHRNISPGIPTAGHQQPEMPSLCFGESATKLNTHPAEVGQEQEARENYSGRSGPGLKAVGFLKLESKTQRGAENTLQMQADI